MSKLDFIANNSFKKVAIFLITISSTLIFYKMTGRSIWIDEGMLLKSIFANSLLDFVNPLPYYDQAQPLLVSIAHKLVTLVSIEFQIIRAILLILCLIPIVFFATKISKNEKINSFLISLVLFSTILTVGFYLTEIKHYSFEIMATFGMIYFVNNFFNEKSSYFTTAILVSLIATIGFSSIIPACMVIFYISFFKLYKEKTNFFTKKNIFGVLLSLVLIAITYLHMKHLTIFQIANHDVYLSKGIFGDVKSLAGAAGSAYGIVFMLVSAFSSIAVLFFSNRKSFLFHLNNIFLLTVGIVTLAKLVGAYPVISDRHIVWIVPFSIFIVALFLNDIYQEKNKRMQMLFVLLLIALFIQASNIVYKSFTTELRERTANNLLYEFVGNLKQTTIIVYPHANPSLEYYLKIDKNLQKHQYFGLQENLSQLKDLNFSKERFFKLIDDSLLVIPKNSFYYLISHLQPIDEKNEVEWQSWRSDYLLLKFEKLGCQFKSIFKKNGVQVLEMECQHATNPKP